MPVDEMLKRASRQRETVRSMALTDVAELQTSMQAVMGANRVTAQKMLARLRRYQSELADFDRTILDNVADADYDTEVAAVYKQRNTLTDAIAELDSKVSDCQMPSTSAQMPVLEERIPEMELTEFDGNPLNFEEFWDDFSTSVDKRTDISTITKFKLLRKCLVGKAAATCKNYRLTTANYEQVKSILEERYGDKETAIAMHLDALIRMKPAASDAVSELIRLRDDCELHVRALVILGFGDDAFGQLFAPIILSKLPANVRLEIRKQKKLHGDIKWTMKRLRELLSTEIGLRASNEYEFLGSHSSDCAETDKPETSKASDSSLFVNSSGPANSRKGGAITCAFCNVHHYSSNCDVYVDVASRQSRMGDRCFLCLRRGHWKKDCRANRKPCFYCRKRDHHCSLCLRKFGSPSKLQRESEQQQQLASYEPHRFLSETICTANCRPSTSGAAGQGGVAILETAVAKVIGQTGSCQARLVLDSGSTKSFMSAQLARRIGADLLGYDRNNIGRFGDAMRVSKELPRYEFCLVLRDGSRRTLRMNAEERLAPSVALQPFDVNAVQSYCKPGDLAEVIVDRTTEAEIDIILGLDYYYLLLGPRQIKADNGLVLKDSCLGVIVTGYTKPDTACQSTVSGERSQYLAETDRRPLFANNLCQPLDLTWQSTSNGQRPAVASC